MTRPKTIVYETRPEDCTVGVIIDLPLKECPTVLNKKAKQPWVNVDGIKRTIEIFLDELIASLIMEDEIKIDSEISFPSVDAAIRDCSDLVVTTMLNFSSVIGTVEVKKPKNSWQEANGKTVYDMNNLDQIVQYLYGLRSTFGVRFCIGIMTTYTEWRIVWFEDSNEAVQVSEKEDFQALCSKSPSNSTVQRTNQNTNTISANVPDKIIVMKSRVFKNNDKELIPILRTLLYK